MKPEILKPTHRNKCEYCDELATYKFKEKKADIYSYICKNCYSDLQKSNK